MSDPPTSTPSRPIQSGKAPSPFAREGDDTAAPPVKPVRPVLTGRKEKTATVRRPPAPRPDTAAPDGADAAEHPALQAKKAAASRRVPRMTPERLSALLSLAWLILLVSIYRTLGSESTTLNDILGMIVVAMSVFLPIAMIWLASVILHSAREMRYEAMRLQATVEGVRQEWIRERQAAGLALKPTVEEKLDAIAEAQSRAEVKLALFTSTREAAIRRAVQDHDTPPAEGVEDAQSALALDTPRPMDKPLSEADFIRALHFPENESDTEGFEALRRALLDHRTASLIRAAQDVLTVLAEEGIYMDDLRPERVRPEIWRAFATGARGEEVSGLGGIRDRSCLALSYARLRSDPAFRESAHRFLRAFDLRFTDFERSASDDAIVRLAETRSARAFMLLGRVTGMLG